MVDSISALIYTIIGIIPGFIIYTIIHIKLPLHKKDFSIYLLDFIVLSMINYCLWFWKFPSLYLSRNNINFSFLFWCMLIFVISPVIIGFLIATFAETKAISFILRSLGFGVSSCPTAWDYKFHNLKESRNVIVTLKNGSIIYGTYGPNSYAPEDALCNDLYLEILYSPDGTWSVQKHTDGILICKDQIAAIEFYK